jgi:putative zinc finger/helix-turn-helix YgiT family protein
MKSILNCPFCNGTASLHKEARAFTYRKESFQTVSHYYACNKCKEEFTTTESDTISMAQVYNQYREKHNIPFEEEIASIRHKYELSASKMSEVLGLGANGYGNYENGEMPTPAYGNLIRATAQPATFLMFLEKAKDHFTPSAYKKVKERVAQVHFSEKEQKDLYAQLHLFSEPNTFTGFRKPQLLKIAQLITYYIQHSKPEFNDRLKLSKQLFFTDFLHYKLHGFSISGLSYKAFPYGPAPAHYDGIYAYLEEINSIVPHFYKIQNGGAAETFQSSLTFDKSLFSETEKTVLKTISEKFANVSSWEIVDYSQKQLNSNTSDNLINYQESAFQINDF